MGRRQAATSGSVEEDRGLDAFGQTPQGLGCIAPPDSRTRHDHRTLSLLKNGSSLENIFSFGNGTTRGTIIRRFSRVESSIGVEEVVEHVHWHLQEGWARFAAQHLTKGDGGIFSQPRCLMDGACPLGDGAQQVYLVHLLQCTTVPQTQWSGTTNDQDGAARKIGIRNARNSISDAWT